MSTPCLPRRWPIIAPDAWPGPRLGIGRFWRCGPTWPKCTAISARCCGTPSRPTRPWPSFSRRWPSNPIWPMPMGSWPVSCGSGASRQRSRPASNRRWPRRTASWGSSCGSRAGSTKRQRGLQQALALAHPMAGSSLQSGRHPLAAGQVRRRGGVLSASHRFQAGLCRGAGRTGPHAARTIPAGRSGASLPAAALRRAPLPSAQLGLGICYLLQEDYQRGWPAFEGRLRIAGARPLPDIPRWQGEDLTGRSLLVVAEAGFGDTLHFLRYARLLKARGARVVFAVQPSLGRLLASHPDIDELCLLDSGQELPHCDFCLSMLSLPGAFQTTAATIPREVPYLRADPALEDHWRRELAKIDAFKIGIVWQGSRVYVSNHWRSIPLAQFAPLAAHSGVRLISLQKGDGSEQATAVDFPVLDLSGRLDEQAGPFMDTAAVIKNLNLVVTCDTGIGHLAGALGAAGVGGPERFQRLALAARPRRLSLVSQLAAVPATDVWPMARRLRADGRSPRHSPLGGCAMNTASSIDLDALFGQALAAQREGRLAEAAEAYRRILAAQPDAAEPHYYWAVCSGSRESRAKRQHTSDKRSRTDRFIPKRTTIWASSTRNTDSSTRPRPVSSKRSRWHRRMPRPTTTWETFSASAASSTRPRRAMSKRSRFAQLCRGPRQPGHHPGPAGAASRAGAHFEQAIALAPGNPESHCNLGNVLWQQGQLERAAAQYEQALALRPQLTEAYNNLGNVLWQQGRLDEAVARSEQGAGLRPEMRRSPQ